MRFREILRLFSRQWREEDGTPVASMWIAAGDRAVLFNPNSGAVIADLVDDGYGKFETTVFASPLEALRLLRQKSGFIVSLRAFPRITLALRYLPADSLPEAQQMLTEILSVRHP